MMMLMLIVYPNCKLSYSNKAWQVRTCSKVFASGPYDQIYVLSLTLLASDVGLP
jgi:hypothetical protein